MPVRALLLLMAVNFFSGNVIAHDSLPELAVSENGRYLVQGADQKPFFYLGDTAWELFHRLDREEAMLYLDDRAAKGFNVIQAVVLAELDGLTTGNAYGETPLLDNDPVKWNEAYFKHVDWIVREANKRGLYIAMLPTWGDKWNKKGGVGPEIFTKANAKEFGAMLAKRYGDDGIIWILGGDRPPENETHLAIIRAMAAGIRSVVGAKQLMTYHPCGGQSSVKWFHNDDWLDFNMFQSGHSKRDAPNYQFTQKAYAMKPAKPVLDGEPRYEDHPINWKPQNGWFDDFDVRQAAWWSVLSGACGNTYGNHNIWQMWEPGRHSSARTPWQKALNHPGAAQLGLMRKLLEKLDFQELEPCPEILKTAGGPAFQVAARNKQCLIVYSPMGEPISIATDELLQTMLHSHWWNPRDGQWQNTSSRIAGSRHEWTPPTKGRGQDWVLVIE